MLYNYQVSEKTQNIRTKIIQYLEEIKETETGNTHANLVKYIPIKNRLKSPSFIKKYKNITSPTQLNEIANQRFRIEEINTQKAYNLIDQVNNLSVDTFLASHKLLMSNLLSSPGEYRKTSMDIRVGKKLSHAAPPAIFVPSMISKLFDSFNNTQECLFIKSCVLYNQIGRIHPFLDGNGRIQRYWFIKSLMEVNPIFYYLPIERILKQNHKKHFQALRLSDTSDDATPIIEMMIETVIYQGLKSLFETKPSRI